MHAELARLLRTLAASTSFFLALVVSGGTAAVTYTYDPLGRVTTAVYDNGLCIAYAYDANGNRTSQVNTLGGPPQTAIWGSGLWGCFNWTQ